MTGTTVVATSTMCCLRYEIGKMDYHRTTSMTFTLLVYQTSVVKALRSYKTAQCRPHRSTTKAWTDFACSSVMRCLPIPVPGRRVIRFAPFPFSLNLSLRHRVDCFILLILTTMPRFIVTTKMRKTPTASSSNPVWASKWSLNLPLTPSSPMEVRSYKNAS